MSFYIKKSYACLLIMLFVSSCSSLSPTPYSDALYFPVKVFIERPSITKTKHFKPENIGRIVVSIENTNIKKFKQGNLYYLLETEAMSTLLKKGYNVVTRTDDLAREKEIRKQSLQKTSGAVAPNMTTNASVQLVINVTKVITKPVKDKENGNKIFYNNHVSVSMRLINLQSSQLLWTGTIDHTKWIENGLEINSIQHALKQLMDEFPKKKTKKEA